MDNRLNPTILHVMYSVYGHPDILLEEEAWNHEISRSVDPHCGAIS